MAAERQTKDIFWYLFNRYPGSNKWCGWELFKLRFWRNKKIIWHDTFGKRWYRAMGCFHEIKLLESDNGEKKIKYCFKCEREIK